MTNFEAWCIIVSGVFAEQTIKRSRRLNLIYWMLVLIVVINPWGITTLLLGR